MAGRLFGMTTSANSSFYTQWALKTLLKHTQFTENDTIYLIDNDNCYSEPVDDRINIIKNVFPLSFAQNVNKLISMALYADQDLIFLSNDILLTKNWLSPLEAIEDAISIPSCNQTHQYNYNGLQLNANMDWNEYNHQYITLSEIARLHSLNNHGYFERLLMPFYLFRLPKSVYLKLGHMDTKFVNGGEDIDYRLRAIINGIDIKYAAKSYVLHFNGKSTWRGAEDLDNTKKREQIYKDNFVNKWNEDLFKLLFLGNDPNSVLQKYNLMSFNNKTDSFNKLIQSVFKLSKDLND
jgi:GT2 family glycosyltransferase